MSLTEPWRAYIRRIVGDGFPFNKKTGGFDFIVQILNFMAWINSKAPVQRRVFGACVGEKHPLVALYLDKVFAPQVSMVVIELASLLLPHQSGVLAPALS